MNSSPAIDAKHAELRLIEAERARRARKKQGYIIHRPHQKQEEFLALDCLEALYGGAAGGGKSDALLMSALRFVHEPSYTALILRRTYQELIKAGALMDRAHEWLDGTDAKWEASARRWRFPSGATIEFGYFDNWGDRGQYMSAEFSQVLFDELTHFPQEWYDFMFTRIRRLKGSTVPSLMRAATNPGSIGHEWVMRRFLESKHPDRAFVPATFRDNPYVDQADYERQLNLAGEILRRQMLGEWIHDGTGLVYRGFDPKRNCIDKLPDLQHYAMGCDFGIVDECAITILGWRDHDQNVYVVESKRLKMGVHEMSLEVKALEKKYGFMIIVGDEGGQGKAFGDDMRRYHGIPIEPVNKQQKVGNIRLVNDELARGRILIYRPMCEDLVSEMKELYWDETGLKEIKSALNHACDSFLYAWKASWAFVEEAYVPPTRGSFEEMRQASEKEYLKLPKEDRAIWEARDQEILQGRAQVTTGPDTFSDGDYSEGVVGEKAWWEK